MGRCQPALPHHALPRPRLPARRRRGEAAGAKYIYDGYKIVCFPDSLDKGANIDIGYIPGKMPWLVGEHVRKLGVEIINDAITGQVHRDRYLLTGDSPLASNNLGKLAAEALLEEVAKRPSP